MIMHGRLIHLKRAMMEKANCAFAVLSFVGFHNIHLELDLMKIEKS